MENSPLISSILERQQFVQKSLGKGALTVSSYYPSDRFAFPLSKDASGPLGLTQLDAAMSVASKWDESHKAIPFTISVYDEDRDGDVVVPMGCHLANYRRNPVVFFGHQEWKIPIGVSRSPDRLLSVWPEEMRIRAKCYFDQPDPDAMFIYGKVKRGILSAASIAFVPIEAFRREVAEKAQHSQPQSGWIFKSFDLTEWSIVGVPANAGAIRDALDSEKAFISPQLQKALVPYCAVAKGRCFSGYCAPCIPCTKGRVAMVKKSVNQAVLDLTNTAHKLDRAAYEQKLNAVKASLGSMSSADIQETAIKMGMSPRGKYTKADLLKWIQEIRGSWERAHLLDRPTTIGRKSSKQAPPKSAIVPKKGCSGCNHSKPCGKCSKKKGTRVQADMESGGVDIPDKKDMNTTSGTAGGYAVPEKEVEEMKNALAKKKSKAKAEESVEDMEAKAEMPLSAKVLSNVHQHHENLKAYLKSVLPPMEHEEIKGYLQKHLDKDLEMHTDKIKSLFSQHHPDHEMKAEEETEPEEEKTEGMDHQEEQANVQMEEMPEEVESKEDGDEVEEKNEVDQGNTDESTQEILDRYRGKSSRKSVKKELGADMTSEHACVKEACDYMKDLADAQEIPIRHKSGLRYHAASLGSYYENASNPMQEEMDLSQDMPATEEPEMEVDPNIVEDKEEPFAGEETPEEEAAEAAAMDQEALEEDEMEEVEEMAVDEDKVEEKIKLSSAAVKRFDAFENRFYRLLGHRAN